MAQHSFEVFKWSGTHYNATYNTSHTAVVDDDDGSYEGSGDSGEQISIDGDSASSSSSQPYSIDVSFTDTGGQPHVETFYFMNTGGEWYFAPGPGSEFTVGATLGSYQSHTTGWDYDDVACFASGTMIETIEGPVAVESLTPGTLLALDSGGFNRLRLCLSRFISAPELAQNPRLRPVCISAGTLGGGLPERDLWVSRQHRMLVSSNITARMFGSDVLVPAIKLTALPGIFIDEGMGDVTYHHLLFDQHEVIFAEGAPSESFFATERSLGTLSANARAELEALYPDLTDHMPQPARHIPAAPQQKRLIARQRKNAKPLLLM